MIIPIRNPKAVFVTLRNPKAIGRFKAYQYLVYVAVKRCTLW